MVFGIWCLLVNNDERLQKLEAFVHNQCNIQGSLVALNGDASFRRYYRIANYIAVDSPPNSQKNQEFFEINCLLKQNSIPVFNILFSDIEHGFFVLEDLGDKTLFNLDQDKKDFFYKKALVTCHKLSLIPSESLPLFDRKFILQELNIFKEYMLENALHLKLNKSDEQLLDKIFNLLADNCLKQPQITMHRDFHSRNLMIKNDELYVIDYQDMVKGPMLYDLASLLFDCYVRLEDEYRINLAKIAYELYATDQTINITSFDDFYYQMCLTAMQRQVKVLGIFCRLAIRDGKKSYLKDLPLVLSYVLYFCSLDSRFKEFEQFLRKYVCGHLPT